MMITHEIVVVLERRSGVTGCKAQPPWVVYRNGSMQRSNYGRASRQWHSCLISGEFQASAISSFLKLTNISGHFLRL